MCPQSPQTKTKREILGKRICEFGERLAVSPLELIEANLVKGLHHIIQSVGSDRICWYEVDEASAAIVHKYTASANGAPLSPKVIPTAKMPYLAERLAQHEVVALQDPKSLPPQGQVDRKFLEDLGVRSLLLIPSKYSPRRKGVLGVSSYSVRVTWGEDCINQLAIAANIIGASLERRNAQSAMQESEDRFRYLFAQAPIGIALETLDGRLLEVNPAFCSMLGYTAEELLRSTCTRISHPDDEEVEKPLLDELRLGLRSSYRIEKRFFRKDGSQMWGEVSVSLLNSHQRGTPIVIGMVSDITEHKTVEASLHLRDQELQRLAGHLIEAQETERRRISCELHDDIGQRVALLACELDVESRQKSAARTASKTSVLVRARQELDAIAADIHKLSHDLHSASLKCSGLELALRDLCWKYSGNHQLEIELRAENVDASLSSDLALCLFRVAQEALANVLKHGRTKRVFVNLTQDSGKVRLTVKDCGIGFDASAQSEGIGLISMRERLLICGGVLSVKSALRQGTEITAEVAALKVRVAAAR